MPTLNWIGKEAVVNHHEEVPFHLLRCDDALSVGAAGSGNLLIQGDNLLALKALLPYYAGKVKCIYIDPPYNTGNEGWSYNDNVNSPEIREWLGRVVGKEAEDLSRHDKWLCMMYPRLVLLRRFLRDDGIIFVSIDDNEVHNARCIFDEIFGRVNFLACIVWQKRTSPDARLPLGPAHDYLLVYGKYVELAKKGLNKLPLAGKRASQYKNLDSDPRGPWASVDMTGQTGHATANQFYEISTPTGKKYRPPKGRCWAMAEHTFLEMVTDNRIWFGKKGTSRPRVKKFLNEGEGTTAWTWWDNSEVGHNQEATKELNALLQTSGSFETPKPVRLLDRILRLATDKNSIVLDSFAGSGTTGHAVMKLNSEDNGHRKFLLIEMDADIATEVTYKRLEVVSAQVVNESGFRYCHLGPTLFDADGQIRPDVTYAELARHVYFSECGEPLSGEPIAPPLVSYHQGTAIYLLFNGALGDNRPEGGNVLTRTVLAGLPAHSGPRVVYAEGCTLTSNYLTQQGVIFRQTPYEIRVR